MPSKIRDGRTGVSTHQEKYWSSSEQSLQLLSREEQPYDPAPTSWVSERRLMFHPAAPSLEVSSRSLQTTARSVASFLTLT